MEIFELSRGDLFGAYKDLDLPMSVPQGKPHDLQISFFRRTAPVVKESPKAAEEEN